MVACLRPRSGAAISPALSRSVAQSGSAPRSGRGGRRFKSCHSDHHLADINMRASVAAATFGCSHADGPNCWLVSETGRGIHQRLLHGWVLTKRVALRQIIQCKHHQRAGDAGRRRRNGQLRASLGLLPAILRSDHHSPPSAKGLLHVRRRRRQPAVNGSCGCFAANSLLQKGPQVLGIDLNCSESRHRLPTPAGSLRCHGPLTTAGAGTWRAVRDPPHGAIVL
jgi:hypothetical protein